VDLAAKNGYEDIVWQLLSSNANVQGKPFLSAMEGGMIYTINNYLVRFFITYYFGNFIDARDLIATIQATQTSLSNL
jgi:hypothetical protein